MCINAFLGQGLKHMLKYFAALGLWAGNENSIGKTINFDFLHEL